MKRRKSSNASKPRAPASRRAAGAAAKLGVLRVTDQERADAHLHAVASGLRAVVQIADELMGCDNEDLFCRTAVELARQRLGLERCAIFFTDGKTMRGTYGTDRKGRTTDEHFHRFTTPEDWLKRFRHIDPEGARMTITEGPYYEVKNGRVSTFGHGWIAFTPILSASQLLGVFHNDSAMTGAPVDETRQELVSVLCSLLGDMLDRMRTESRRRAVSDGLRAVVQATDELIACHDLDTLYRRGVEIPREKLGVERCAIFLHEGDKLRGTYGTNRKRETTPERDHFFPSTPQWMERLQALRNQKQRSLVIQSPHHEWKKGRTVEFGRGWVNVIPIFAETEFIGILCHDAAISGAPPDPVTQEILLVYCSLFGALAERKRIEERQRRVSDGLRAVVGVADELLASRGMDELYRRAVELARDKLHVERCAIFLRDGDRLRGTYGTSLERKTTDEHTHVFAAYPDWLEHFEQLKPGERQMVLRSEPYTEWDGGRIRRFDKGWVAITPIQSSGDLIGVFSNDTAISRDPVDEAQQEILSVYGSLLGAIIERKRADENRRHVSEGLRTVLQVADELMACPDLDTLYRRAVELAREQLGIERCSIFVWEDGEMRGTYGTDKLRRTSDERTHILPQRKEWLKRLDDLKREDRRMIVVEQPYVEWAEGQEEKFGHGWIAITPIQSARQFLGVFCNDAAITGKPLDENAQEIVTVYCSILGTILERRKAEDGLQGANASLTREVAERKRAEGELRRLAMVVQQQAEAVVLADRAGAIQYVNPAFERISGYSSAEVLGKNPRILKSGRQDAAFYRNMWASLARGEVWTGHFTNRRKDGSLYEMESTISPIRDESGGIIGYASTSRDVTHELQLEQQYRQAQKMEAIGRLAGGIAHDFNNLLTSILGYSRLIQDELGEGSPIANDLEEVVHAGERAAALTRQLLTFSRKQAIQTRPISLNTVVGDMDKLLRRTLGEDIELVTLLDSAMGYAKADPGLIEQIIMNLAINARDAMPRGGTLTIQTTTVDLNEHFCAQHVGVTPGKYVSLSVRDTGAGMEREVFERCFEPFFTTKEQGKGTGLGLSIVYSIVGQLGGFITADSAINQGSTFTAYLPHVAPPADKAPARDKLDLPRGSETILVVEDEEAVRRLTVRLLESLGYHVLQARHGGEALLICERHPGPIQLVLTDVVMPHIGGQELVERLRQIRKEFKVLYMSGFTEDLFSGKRSPLDKDPLILKPFTNDALAARIRQLLDAD